MSGYQLSKYIAGLQKILQEHGDILVGTATGNIVSNHEIEPEVMRSTPLDENRLGRLDSKESLKICVVDKQPEAGHPYYDSMAYDSD